MQGHGIDLIGRLRELDAATRGLDEVARVALRRRSAFIVQGVCLIHRMRVLVQSALQAALRQRGLNWGAYELNHALVLDDENAAARWLGGGDPLASAAVDR